MKRILFAAVLTVAFMLPTPAWAAYSSNAAYIKSGGGACTSCQFIITKTPCVFEETAIVNTGPVQTVYKYFRNVETGQLDYPVVLNVSAIHPGGACCPASTCKLTAWARKPCPNGYFFSEIKTGPAVTDWPNFWGTFTINTSHCNTQSRSSE